jgi:hypothetical protein
MTRVQIDNSLRDQFLAQRGTDIEVCDQSGNLIGFFRPFESNRGKLPPGMTMSEAEAMFSREELEASRNSTGRRIPMDEVLRHFGVQ